MIGNRFRPWGELEWLLPKLPSVKWDIFSCLSPENRFVATFDILQEKVKINNALFLKIVDPPSKDSDDIKFKLEANEVILKESKVQCDIEEHELLEPYKKIVDTTNAFLRKSNGNVIVDISTFPKRFFFPIVKLLIKGNLKNLVITYSTPKQYCSTELSSNPQSWDHLPLFMPVDFPEPQIDVALVGVGFMPFGLPELLLSNYNATPVKFLFPFPPGPPNYQRTWDFVRKIEKSFSFKPSDSIIRLDANNMPDAFEYISRETNEGAKNVIFAPYGPKPISLAMCIHAVLHNSLVYYTQPTHYSPEYSTGVKDTFAYAIVIDSKNLYQQATVASMEEFQ
ncbi:MAG: hypothetical protein EOO47_14355 [Flavobacterium sp.]|nr:MAG: hypothetical protein EOO47_14355 [Flavobacterium sp.]